MTGNRSVPDDEEEGTRTPQHQRLLSRSSSQSTTTSSVIEDDAEYEPPEAAPPRSARKLLSSAAAASSVQVAVRVRPLLSSLESGCGSCIHVVPSQEPQKHPSTIKIGADNGPTFTFDEVFPTTTTQNHVFDHRVAPLVASCMEGYNATLLAYGQTGSGKTHTVIGPSTCHAAPDDPNAGMVPRAVTSLFEQLQEKYAQAQQQKKQLANAHPSNSAIHSTTTPNKPNATTNNDGVSYDFQVRVQFLELYGEEIRDLLATPTASTKETLKIRDLGNDEPEVVGATSQVVESAEEALRCLTRGMLRRVTAATAMNESSSRSHAIFSILIDQTWNTVESTTVPSTPGVANNDTTGTQVRRSKFNFVDLAGSERQKRTQAEGRRLKEGIDINKGLLVLGNVISALGDPKKRGKAFVPYRDSKLTRLLKGSLGGNHKTLMIACVSPSSTNMDESLNCLRYANRAKNIQNRAIVNVDARSRLIAELKVQVQALASEMIRIQDSGDISTANFTRQDLETMASGGADGMTLGLPPLPSSTSSRKAPSSTSVSSYSGPTPARLFSPDVPSSSNETELVQHQQRLQDTEEELDRTRNQLKRCRLENVTVEERLHVTIAEKEFYRLQLETTATETDPQSNSTKGTIDQAFVNRASQYEKEIDRLKDELRVVRLQLVEEKTTKDNDDLDTSITIDKATKELAEDRERLAVLQNELLSAATPESPRKAQSTPLSPSTRQDTGDIESEAKAEEDHVTELTLKYSAVDEEDRVMLSDKSPHVDDDTPRHHDDERASEHRRAQIEADLLEIERFIESKEELISQLQCSQAKYSSMKEFYEGKLHQMEQLLDQKEEERQKMVIELDRLKENNHDTKELEAQLKKQDEHIEGIRKQKRQLKDLTAVSSKNATEIMKLQNDVKAMKQRKVSMQKQLTEERKAHAQEIKRLRKEVIQKDRETRKWQKTADKKNTEAEKANQMAKTKGVQLGQLREKYKHAEKTIRMLQIKRGVMAKAGLDSVIVGRRTSQAAPKKNNESRNPADDDRSIDVDAIRDYFDQKVAEVGRKESLADKLARGWEEHFQLTLERNELAERDSADSQEEIQSLDLRIQYEEDRIRKLANRLGKVQAKGSEADSASAHADSILFGRALKKLCKDASPAKASEIAAKVLFGMVVRERRRIASLAKTASSLDEKLQELQANNEAQEVAFRSYVQDSQQDFANLSMNHQEQILGLMSMVKNDEKVLDTGEMSESDGEVNMPFLPDAGQAANLLVLANERNNVLEQQLRELRGEIKVGESYRAEKEEMRVALESKQADNEQLEINLAGLRNTLRQVRELITNDKNSADNMETVHRSCVAIIREALSESHSPYPLSPMARRHSCPTGIYQTDSLSPQAKRQLEFVQGADDDDEDDEESPEWADEIMADLAFIAEGRLPPSLQNVPGIFDTDVNDDSQVHSDRHEDPLTLTQVESNTVDEEMLQSLSPQRPDERRYEMAILDNQKPRSSFGGKISGTPVESGSPLKQNPVSPSRTDELQLSSSSIPANTVPPDDAQKSVFDRLVNPTNFTGTQKEKHHLQTGAQKERQENAAQRMLDQLLESESDLPKVRVAEPATTKVHQYTQQNVFERLQKTTTQSFAVKHAPSFDSPEPQQEDAISPTAAVQNSDVGKGVKLSSDPKGKRSLLLPEDRAAPTAKGNTTRNKSPSGTRLKSGQSSGGSKIVQPRPPTPKRNGSMPSRARTPTKTRSEQYAQENVYERLTKTTTEAYAVKKRVSGKN